MQRRAQCRLTQRRKILRLRQRTLQSYKGLRLLSLGVVEERDETTQLRTQRRLT